MTHHQATRQVAEAVVELSSRNGPAKVGEGTLVTPKLSAA